MEQNKMISEKEMKAALSTKLPFKVKKNKIILKC